MTRVNPAVATQDITHVRSFKSERAADDLGGFTSRQPMGLAALAGGEGPRWQRRVASVAFMFAGAAAEAWLVARSVALALAVAGVVSCTCAFMAHRGLR